MILALEKYPKLIPPDMEELIFEALLEMKDIHFPEVSIFPLAPIWYLGLGIFFLILVYWFKKKYLCYQGRVGRAKKRALKKLDKLVSKHSNDNEIAVFASEISILLKRIAIVCFGKDKVATLYGEEWGEFVEQKTNLKPDKEIIFLITSAGYMNPKKDEKTNDYILKLNVFVKEWINSL